MFTPTTVALPDRSNAVSYPDDHIQAVVDALLAAEPGTGVQVDDNQPTEGKARTRTRAMKLAITRYLEAQEEDPITVREHFPTIGDAPESEDDEDPREWLPVLSIKPGASGE